MYVTIRVHKDSSKHFVGEGRIKADNQYITGKISTSIYSCLRCVYRISLISHKNEGALDLIHYPRFATLFPKCKQKILIARKTH